MLATITTDLDEIAPRFELQPDQITIIQTPTEFYETLKVGDMSWTSVSLHSICRVVSSSCRYCHRPHTTTLKVFRSCM
jgi:hypothetical protein